MFSILLSTVILSLFALSFAAPASSTPTPNSTNTAACVSFDLNWNLLAFGFNGKDYNAGTKDTWGSGKVLF